MKVVSIVGARPQFIKAAAVSAVFQNRGGVKETLVHTGQHYDHNMSRLFFDELGIPEPEVNLGIGSLSHGAQTGRMLEAIERELMEREPDYVQVYGDTNSTLAGAVAGAKLDIVVGHVEAGLRSFNRSMPEETNRVLADHASDLLFAPTRAAVENLGQEGLPVGTVHLVGDVMYDAAIRFGAIAREKSGILEELGLAEQEYVLATIHRAENTDRAERLRRIFTALDAISHSWPVVLPLHPRTRQALERNHWLDEFQASLRILEPVGYLDMLRLERSARVVVTDSGGVQKEAFFQKTPCVTLRDETEWVELVEHGVNRLCPPTGVDEIVAVVREAGQETIDEGMPELYGGGQAADRIADVVAALG